MENIAHFIKKQQEADVSHPELFKECSEFIKTHLEQEEKRFDRLTNKANIFIAFTGTAIALLLNALLSESNINLFTKKCLYFPLSMAILCLIIALSFLIVGISIKNYESVYNYQIVRNLLDKTKVDNHDNDLELLKRYFNAHQSNAKLNNHLAQKIDYATYAIGASVGFMSLILLAFSIH